MEENFVNSIDNSSSVTTSDDPMLQFVRMVFVVVIGGLVIKYIKKFVNWLKEGQRLRREEKERKQKQVEDERVEQRAQELVDAMMAKQVTESEKDSKEN